MSGKEPEPVNVSPSMQMMQLLWPGAMAVQAVHVAAELSLADLGVDRRSARLGSRGLGGQCAAGPARSDDEPARDHARQVIILRDAIRRS
jgi:hypothetical protein